MHKKPLHIEWADRLLMAPWRYMDFKGKSPSKNYITNLIHLPETKTLAVTAAAVAALNGGVRNTIIVLAAAGATVAIQSLMQRPAGRSSFYLDTQPTEAIRLSPQASKLLKDVRPSLISIFMSAAPVTVGAVLGSSLAGRHDPFAAATLIGATFMFPFVRGLSLRYRINRIADGDWNLQIGSAPPEPKPVQAESVIGETAPQPT